MSLFDYVRCEYPLPGNPPSDVASLLFQSKELDCYMHTYTITAEGQITGGEGDYSHFTGVVELDYSNVCGSGPGIYTRNGEDAHYLGYRLTFVDGKVASAEETENHSEPAAPSSMQNTWTAPTATEIKLIKKRQAESLAGRRMLIWWGGDVTPPYWSTVIAETDRELVFKSDAGNLDTVHRAQRDCTFFDSMEDGQAYKDARTAEWQRGKKEYEDHVAAKKRKGSG